MGYSMHQVDGKFTIKKENQEAAFQAVKKQMSDSGYHWIEYGWKKGLRDIFAVLEFWLYQPTIDDATGDIIDLHFNAEKLGDEIELFKVIAPYVEAGSYLHMEGEDDYEWRWNFDGITCTQNFLEDNDVEEYDVSLDEEFQKYAAQINEKLAESAKLMREAKALAKKAGLPSLINSMYVKEDLDENETNKFEQRLELINTDQIESAVRNCGWNTSSSYC